MKNQIITGLAALLMTGVFGSESYSYPRFDPISLTVPLSIENFSVSSLDPNARYNADPDTLGDVYMFFSYEEWLNLHKNPDSKESLMTCIKAQMIRIHGDLAYDLLTDEEKEELESERSLWDFDEEKYKVNENDDFSEKFFIIQRKNMILEDKRDLSVYGVHIDYKKLSVGEQILIYFDRKYKRQYQNSLKSGD